MGFSTNRAQWISSPLVGWALVSGAVAPALAQTAAPATTTPDNTTTTGVGTTPPAFPGAGGTAPTGIVPGTIVAPTTPDNTTQDTTTPGTTPSGTPAAGGGTRPSQPAPPPNTPTGFAGTVNPQIAPQSYTSNSGQLIYGAAVGTLPSFSGSGLGTEAIGLSMGAFTLFPSIELTTGVDNNVFAQSYSAGTRTSSLYTTVIPTLELRSEWLNHQLRAVLAGGFGFYSGAETQNYQNYSLIVDGKVDIREDLYLTPSIGYKRATEALGTPNTAFAQAPTVVETVPIKLGIYQRFNRFFYEASVSGTRSFYTDHSTITTGGLAAASRDRWDYTEQLKLGYEITNDISIYVAPTANQVRYISKVNAADQSRDSDNMGLLVGSTWIISATSSIDGSLGYNARSYPSGGLAGTTEFVGGLSGTFSPYEPLTLRPNLSRSIQETSLASYKSMVLTALALDFTYFIHDSWSASGGVSYSLTDYIPADGAAAGNPRQDKILRAQIGFAYQLRPQVGIGPVFEYTSGSSTDPLGPAYDREVISIRLTARR